MGADDRDRARLVVLAGSNGAGKTTFFELYLRETGLRFVNADLIARAISPEDPGRASEAAAKAADLERRKLVEDAESFCMETVFSDRAGAKLGFLRDAQRSGFHVHLVFIGLESAELSEARVIQRVSAGGHANLEAALRFVDSADLYDNSDAEQPYRLVARFKSGACVERRSPIPKWARGIL